VRDRWGVLLGAVLAATSALAQSPPHVHTGAPEDTTYEGRHCALHPRFDGPLTLVTGVALPAPAAPAVALLVDASGQVMLVDGPVPGASKLRDSTEPADSDIAELGELVTEPSGDGYAARFRFRYERIECRIAGTVRLAPSPAPAVDATVARTLRLLDASLAIREVDRLRNAGDAGAARPFADQAVATRRELLGRDHRHTLLALDRRGSIEWDLGEHRAADATMTETYERIVATLGAGHPDAYAALQNLALVHWDLGELERADRELHEAIDGRKRVLDADDVDLLGSQLNLATLQGELGDLGDAQAMLEQLFRTYETKVGPDHPSTLMTLNNLATIYRQLGRFDDELRLRELACGRYVRALGEKHPATLRCRPQPRVRAVLGRPQGGNRWRSRGKHGTTASPCWDASTPRRFTACRPMRRRSRTTAACPKAWRCSVTCSRSAARRADPSIPRTLQAMTVLARLEALGGDYAAARQNARTAHDAFAALRPRSPETMIALGRLASIEADMGERTAAIEHYRELVTLVEERRRVESLSAESQRTAFAVWVVAYKRLVSLLADAGATGDAFRQLELSKARGLLETLAHRRAESASGLTRAEQESLRVLERRIDSLDEAVARLRGDPAGRSRSRPSAPPPRASWPTCAAPCASAIPSTLSSLARGSSTHRPRASFCRATPRS
jgi:tetratricopeptide (TPR) repeat protein